MPLSAPPLPLDAAMLMMLPLRRFFDAMLTPLRFRRAAAERYAADDDVMLYYVTLYFFLPPAAITMPDTFIYARCFIMMLRCLRAVATRVMPSPIIVTNIGARATQPLIIYCLFQIR